MPKHHTIIWRKPTKNAGSLPLPTAQDRWFSQFSQVPVDPGEDVAGDLVPVGLVEQLVAPARVEDDGDLSHAGAMLYVRVVIVQNF